MAYPLREDNVFYAIQAPMGIIRYAALEVGERMTERGQMAEPDDVFFLEYPELTSAFQAGSDQHDLVRLRKAGEPGCWPILDQQRPMARFQGLRRAALVLMGVGGLILAVSRDRRDWLRVVGGASLGVAGVVGLIYVYRLATDPGPLYDRDTPALIVVALVSLTAIGPFALGLHFLRSGYRRFDAMRAGGIVRTDSQMPSVKLTNVPIPVRRLSRYFCI